MLKLKALKATIDGKEILKGLDLQVNVGEVHVLMGPNGSGKSTLAQVIAGHPSYKVISGECLVDSQNITELSPDKRAKLGIFLGFQNPVEVPGVSVFNFLRRAYSSVILTRKMAGKNLKKKKILHFIQDDKVIKFREELLGYLDQLKLSKDFLRRGLNEGFSGGEKKRNEILQMIALKPKLVILDEIDSGLDVDGLKLVAGAIKKFSTQNPQSSIILITHYARILKYLKANFVHVMVEGKIAKSGTGVLAKKIEESGYENFKNE